MKLTCFTRPRTVAGSTLGCSVEDRILFIPEWGTRRVPDHPTSQYTAVIDPRFVWNQLQHAPRE